jgi:diacylglycerol kinase family enzyme
MMVGLRATPLAKIDDGLMDLCFMKEGTRGEQLEIFLQLPTGSHNNHPGLKFQQVPHAQRQVSFR